MAAVTFDISGNDDLSGLLGDRSFLKLLVEPGLRSATVPIRKAASKPNYGFTDRTGRLRKSIRREFERDRFRRIGRALVRAGGENARQAWLVEAGHKGPWPAVPHPYLFPALMATVDEQKKRFDASVNRNFPRLVDRLKNRRSRGGLTGATRAAVRRARR